MQKFIATLVVLAALLAGCGGNGSDTPEAQPAATTTVTSAPTTAAPTSTKATATTVSERLAHWQDVVKSMNCPELATLETKRLAVQFNDQAESLIAIHDRQDELHC
jgi:hypothetical protein